MQTALPSHLSLFLKPAAIKISQQSGEGVCYQKQPEGNHATDNGFIKSATLEELPAKPESHQCHAYEKQGFGFLEKIQQVANGIDHLGNLSPLRRHKDGEALQMAGRM